MNRLNKAVLGALLAGFLSMAYAGSSKNTNISPDKPIVTTWSKIKELFQ